MKRAAIHFYTGTGNSKHAAEIAAKELSEQGFSVSITQIMRNTQPPSDPAQLHLFIYPVFAFTYPAGVARYIEQLPIGNGVPTAVIANHGMVSTKGGAHTGYEGAGLDALAQKLSNKGYDVYYTNKVGYTENITILAHARDDQTHREIFEAGDDKMRNMVRDIAAGKKLKQEYSFSIRLASAAMAFLFNYFGRWSLGKLFAADYSCTGCGLCAKICPAQNITLCGKNPDWGWRCQGCLGCFNRCPHNSVQISFWRFLLLYIVSAVPLLLYIFYYMNVTALFALVFGRAAIIIAPLTTVLFTGILIYLLERWTFLCERIPLINRFITLSHTAKLRRYKGGAV